MSEMGNAADDESDIDFLRREIDALFARTKGHSLRAVEWKKRGHAILDGFAESPTNEAEQELQVLRAAVTLHLFFGLGE